MIKRKIRERGYGQIKLTLASHKKIAMQKFDVLYSRQGTLVLIIIAVPLIWLAPFFAAVFLIHNMADWFVITIIILMMVGSLTTLLWMIKRYATVPCEVLMDENRLEVKLLRHSILYFVTHYETNWSNIENVSTNFNNQTNKRFYQVTFKNPGKIITLEPNQVLKSINEETIFGNTLNNYVDKFNTSQQLPASMQIHSKGFYDTRWAKLITFFAWGMTAVIIVAKIASPESISSWKILSFLVYSSMWLTVYYANRGK